MMSSLGRARSGEGIQEACTELTGRTADRPTPAGPRQLLDEEAEARRRELSHESEHMDGDSLAGAARRLEERVAGRGLGGGVGQDEVVALEVRRRLAIGDEEDLPAEVRLAGQSASREPKAGLDVREVARYFRSPSPLYSGERG